MRIHIHCSPTDQLVPFNYQPILTRTLHTWLGWNTLHDNISLYSFSWLQGGNATKKGLQFHNQGCFFISSYDDKVLKRIIQGIQLNNDIGFGLSVKEVTIQETPQFKSEATFFCASPVFIKRRVDESEVHFTYTSKDSDMYLTETLRTKLKKAGLSDDNVTVQFDRSYHSPKTKVIYYNNIGNRVNMCPVKITGTPEQIAFAWNVGVGNSTGIGFGALK